MRTGSSALFGLLITGLLLLPPPASAGARAWHDPPVPEGSGLGAGASSTRDVGPPRVAHPPYTVLARENMPWLCNGCGLTQAQGLDELSAMAENESAVSYEQFFISSSGTFVCQCPDSTVATGLSLGLDDVPMISSADVAGADALVLIENRQLWPAFISAAMSAANASGYAGYNFDIEGTGSGTPPANTSADYAHLLWQFANVSHAQGLQVSVDVAWFDSELWNASYLSATSVDVFFDMDYYSWSYFWNRLDLDLASYPRARLGEGLAGDVGNGVPCPGDVGLGGFSQRIHILESYNITHTAFWAMADYAVGDGCWDYPAGVGAVLHDFLFNGSTSANWTVGMGDAPDGWAFCPGGWNVSGTPVVGACAPSHPSGLNFTLVSANDTGAVGPVTLEGNETATRMWSSPLTEAKVTLWEYLDGANVTLFEQNLSCSGGYVLSSETLPVGHGWFHRNLTLSFPSAHVCGLRFGLETATPGLVSGMNDWFANFDLELPPPLAATLASTPSGGTEPLTVHFFGNATGGLAPYTVDWSFGDGATGSSTPASHTYSTSGTFLVRLTVTDAGGLTISRETNVTVLSSLRPLQAFISATPAAGAAPLTVDLMVTASGGTGSYTHFSWTLGDGTVAEGVEVDHTYSEPGNYSVRAQVTDSSGSVASSLPLLVTVLPEISPLSVTLSTTASSIPVDTEVSWTAHATGGRAPYSYAWSGLPSGCEGTSSSWLNCTPSTAGTYSIQVIVTDTSVPSRSCNATISLNVTSSAGASSAGDSGSSWATTPIELAALAAVLVLGSLTGFAGAGWFLRRRRSDPSAAGSDPPPG